MLVLFETPAQGYDDSYQIEYARRHGAIIVTNDMFRDAVEQMPPHLRAGRRRGSPGRVRFRRPSRTSRDDFSSNAEWNVPDAGEGTRDWLAAHVLSGSHHHL